MYHGCICGAPKLRTTGANQLTWVQDLNFHHCGASQSQIIMDQCELPARSDL